ncbi:hypothetical protein GCM10028801_46360 [Nocardioides maradonensis]
MTLTQRQVYEAISLAIDNAGEVLGMAISAENKEDLYSALVDRFGITENQADVIGSFSFGRMTRQDRQSFAQRLAAEPEEPPA